MIKYEDFPKDIKKIIDKYLKKNHEYMLKKTNYIFKNINKISINELIAIIYIINLFDFDNGKINIKQKIFEN